MRIRSKSLILVLAVIAFVLVVVSLVADWIQLSTSKEFTTKVWAVIRLFDLDTEANIPAFFSVTIITFCACLLLLIARWQRLEVAPFAKHWCGLSFIFFAMAFDEYVGIHALAVDPFRNFGGYEIFFFGWVVPGIVAVVILAGVFVRFLLGLEPRTRTMFAAAGGIYVSGALLVELLEGVIVSGRGDDNWSYVVASTTQESMEMFGILLFLYGLLDYIERHRIVTPISVSTKRTDHTSKSA